MYYPPCDEEPIDEEGGLKLRNDPARQAEMGISPGAHLVAVVVAVGYVHPSHVAYFSVYYGKLAVIAIVHTRGEVGDYHLHKGVDLHTGFSHSLPKGAARSPRAYVVVEDAYNDAFANLLYQ